MRGPGQQGLPLRDEPEKIFTTENIEGKEESGYNPLYELLPSLRVPS